MPGISSDMGNLFNHVPGHRDLYSTIIPTQDAAFQLLNDFWELISLSNETDTKQKSDAIHEELNIHLSAPQATSFRQSVLLPTECNSN
jgi:hypothetical protein